MTAEPFDLPRRLAAEFLGAALLLAVVVGSGLMAAQLSGGNQGLSLLANAVATGAALTVLITIFGPVSGAHFNPAVTLIFLLLRRLGAGAALAYGAVQFLGAAAGVALAHAMFSLPLAQTSHRLRDGAALGLSEMVATFGLVGVILGGDRFAPERVPALVGLYITAAYWFTASTSFANPAVTLARSLTDSFSGIAPASVGPFVAAQLLGALLALIVFAWLFRRKESR